MCIDVSPDRPVTRSAALHAIDVIADRDPDEYHVGIELWGSTDAWATAIVTTSRRVLSNDDNDGWKAPPGHWDESGQYTNDPNAPL